MTTTAPAEPAADFPQTLMALWLRNRAVARPIGEIITEARAGKLAGVESMDTGFGFKVVDEAAALAAMRGA